MKISNINKTFTEIIPLESLVSSDTLNLLTDGNLTTIGHDFSENNKFNIKIDFKRNIRYDRIFLYGDFHPPRIYITPSLGTYGTIVDLNEYAFPINFTFSLSDDFTFGPIFCKNSSVYFTINDSGLLSYCNIHDYVEQLQYEDIQYVDSDFIIQNITTANSKTFVIANKDEASLDPASKIYELTDDGVIEELIGTPSGINLAIGLYYVDTEYILIGNTYSGEIYYPAYAISNDLSTWDYFDIFDEENTLISATSNEYEGIAGAKAFTAGKLVFYRYKDNNFDKFEVNTESDLYGYNSVMSCINYNAGENIIYSAYSENTILPLNSDDSLVATTTLLPNNNTYEKIIDSLKGIPTIKQCNSLISGKYKIEDEMGQIYNKIFYKNEDEIVTITCAVDNSSWDDSIFDKSGFEIQPIFSMYCSDDDVAYTPVLLKNDSNLVETVDPGFARYLIISGFAYQGNITQIDFDETNIFIENYTNYNNPANTELNFTFDSEYSLTSVYCYLEPYQIDNITSITYKDSESENFDSGTYYNLSNIPITDKISITDSFELFPFSSGDILFPNEEKLGYRFTINNIESNMEGGTDIYVDITHNNVLNAFDSLLTVPNTRCLIMPKIDIINPIDTSLAELSILSELNYFSINPILLSEYSANINVIYPNGGEEILQSGICTILWNGRGSTVDIYYNNGTAFDYIIISDYLNTGSYGWQTDVNALSTYKIKVVDHDNTLNMDYSDDVFSIITPLSLIYPNGFEELVYGFTYEVTFSGTCSLITINKYIDGEWTILVKDYNNVNSYPWTIQDDPPHDECLISIINQKNETDFDQSDNYFKIVAPISITYPNGYEEYVKNIEFESCWKGGCSFVDILISYNNGTDWITLESSYINTNMYNFVGDTATESGLIKLINSDNPLDFDVSDSMFRIVEPLVEVITPSGDNCSRGQVYDITWTGDSSVYCSYVNLYYSIDSGFNWTPIELMCSNTGSYSWEVPDVLSSDCMIRVENYYFNEDNITSNTFTIESSMIVCIESGSVVAKDFIFQNRDIAIENESYHEITDGYVGEDNADLIDCDGKNVLWRISADDTSLLQGDTGFTAWLRIKPITHEESYYFGMSKYDELSPKKGWVVNTIGYAMCGGGFSGGTQANGTWQDIILRYSSAEQSWYYNIIKCSDGSSIYGASGEQLEYYDAANKDLIVYGGRHSGSAKTPIQHFCFFNKFMDDAAIEDIRLSLNCLPSSALVLYEPNGGEVLPSNRAFHIISSGITALVNYDYSDDDGLTWNTIEHNVVNIGDYTWLPPSIESSTCLIKISNPYYPTDYDISDNTFTIFESVELSTPNGGENWKIGETHNIEFTAGTSSVDIYYNKGGGEDILIEENYTGGSPYAWEIPNDPSVQVKVKVVNSNNSDDFDQSAAYFTIGSAMPELDISDCYAWLDGETIKFTDRQGDRTFTVNSGVHFGNSLVDEYHPGGKGLRDANDGTGSYSNFLTGNLNPDTNMKNAKTILIKFKLTQNGSYLHCKAGYDKGWAFRLTKTSCTFAYSDTGLSYGGTTVIVTYTLSLDTWYNIIAIRNTDTGKIVVNLYDADGANLLATNNDDIGTWCASIDSYTTCLNMNSYCALVIAHLMVTTDIADSGEQIAMIGYGNTAD